MKRHFLLACLLALVTATCWGQQVFPRIINGEPTDQFPAVGIVGSDELGEFCSGTLITSRHVLTAAHCASVLADDEDGTFRLGSSRYQTIRVFIHPDYNRNTLANDLAILELSEEVEGVTPAQIYRDAPRVNEVLTIVGYGQPGDAGGADGDFGTKRAGTTAIDRVRRLRIEWDFDDPDESNTAPGDSGGPNFLEVESVFFIAGVTSGGTTEGAALGDRAFSTRVDAYADWIDLILSVGTGEEEPEEEGDDPEEGDEGDDPEADDPEADEEVDDEGADGGEVDDPNCPPRRPGRRPSHRPGRRPSHRPGNKPGHHAGHRPGQSHAQPNRRGAQATSYRGGSSKRSPSRGSSRNGRR